jgi:ribonuclease P protein component
MDLSFPKKEHLCLKRRFDALLAQGKSFFIYPFRVIYLLNRPEDIEIPVQVAISVRKKQFKHAVTRNLIKRRFRESWRHQKTEIHSTLTKEGKSMLILMVYGASEVLPYSEINERMKLVIQRLSDLIITETVQ